MEMRKFIVEIHPDGCVYATEYTEPEDDLRRLGGSAFADIQEELNTYPKCFWSDDMKAAYLNGAAAILKRLHIEF